LGLKEELGDIRNQISDIRQLRNGARFTKLEWGRRRERKGLITEDTEEERRGHREEGK
jgi:hypothetical protein